MLISVISILLLVSFSPYIDPRVDAVSWASQVATLLTLLGGAALTGSQGPECDCDTFLGLMSVVLPIFNMLPLVAIVYLIVSTVTDLYASQTLTLTQTLTQTQTQTLRRYAVQRARKPPPQPGVLSDEGPSGTGALSGVPAADRALAEGTHAADRDDRDSSVVVALADRAVLLEGKARWKAESAFYKPAKVQLLAAPGQDGAPDTDAGAPPWSVIVINGKAMPYEEVTAMRVDERVYEFQVEHTRKNSSRTERLHLRMDTQSDFHLWREALRPEMIKPRDRSVASRATLVLKSGQASPSKGATLVAEERVLLEGRMSVRISGSPFHVPMVLKLTAASDSAERKEPWTTFSYTTNHNTVAVPCRAISAVRIHAGDANPSFEIEYAAPREAEVRKSSLEAEGRKKSLPRVSIRMRIWTTSQEQFVAWRKALAPLPLVNVHAMDRARLWLDNHMSELPGAVDELEGEQKGSKKTFDGSV